jgi:outer membrane protein assembly factor BamB
MRTQSLIYRLALALGLSIVALISAVVIQATLLFPEHVRTLQDPTETSIRRIALVADGKRAIALLKHWPRVPMRRSQRTILLCDLVENSHSFQSIDFDFEPWNIVSARGADRLFVASLAGDLYCLDPTAAALQPRQLGRHVDDSPTIMECTHDGSIVLVGDVGCISAWSSDTATCLWRRSDIRITGAHFDATTSRLICGRFEGPCVELDRRTGATLRRIGAPRGGALSLEVSADGRYLATLGFDGQYAVTDLETERALWLKPLPIRGIRPRFSPDGKCVLTIAPAPATDVHALATTTGELLAELRGAKAEIAGIEVSASGIVYAWDKSATLTAWDLETSELLWQYNLTS